MEKSQRLLELETMSTRRLLWKYSLPSIVGLMVMSLYNIIDRIFIGQGVGADAIAGLAITFPVMNITTALGVLIGGGASARMSIVLGEGNRKRAFEILGNSLVMTLVLGFAYLSVFAIFLDDILRLFGASDRTLPYAHDFMLYIMPGLLITNICYSFNNIMRASGYPAKAMVTMFIGAACNLVLAPTFIFGLGWGIKGAAIATDIAMTISATFVMAHFINQNSEIHFRRGIYRLKKEILINITSIGSPPFIVNSAGCVVNALIINILYLHGGDSAVAAMGIFVSVIQLLITIIIGLSQGMQPIVGYNYGCGNISRLKSTYWLTVRTATLFTTVGFLLFQFTPQYISRAFTTDQQLIDVTANGLRLATAMFFLVGFQIVSGNFFQSISMAKKSIFLSLVRQLIYLIPILMVLPRFKGLDGVWLSFSISDLLSVFTAVVLIRIQFRQFEQRETLSR